MKKQPKPNSKYYKFPEIMLISSEESLLENSPNHHQKVSEENDHQHMSEDRSDSLQMSKGIYYASKDYVSVLNKFLLMIDSEMLQKMHKYLQTHRRIDPSLTKGVTLYEDLYIILYYKQNQHEKDKQRGKTKEFAQALVKELNRSLHTIYDRIVKKLCKLTMSQLLRHIEKNENIKFSGNIYVDPEEASKIPNKSHKRLPKEQQKFNKPLSFVINDSKSDQFFQSNEGEDDQNGQIITKFQRNRMDDFFSLKKATNPILLTQNLPNHQKISINSSKNNQAPEDISGQIQMANQQNYQDFNDQSDIASQSQSEGQKKVQPQNNEGLYYKYGWHGEKVKKGIHFLFYQNQILCFRPQNLPKTSNSLIVEEKIQNFQQIIEVQKQKDAQFFEEQKMDIQKFINNGQILKGSADNFVLDENNLQKENHILQQQQISKNDDDSFIKQANQNNKNDGINPIFKEKHNQFVFKDPELMKLSNQIQEKLDFLKFTQNKKETSNIKEIKVNEKSENSFMEIFDVEDLPQSFPYVLSKQINKIGLIFQTEKIPTTSINKIPPTNNNENIVLLDNSQKQSSPCNEQKLIEIVQIQQVKQNTNIIDQSNPLYWYCGDTEIQQKCLNNPKLKYLFEWSAEEDNILERLAFYDGSDQSIFIEVKCMMRYKNLQQIMKRITFLQLKLKESSQKALQVMENELEEKTNKKAMAKSKYNR